MNSPLSEQKDFNYDVFLSHSDQDRPVVRELATRLKAHGLRVWFDEWEIQRGGMTEQKVENGLETSRVLVLCMSRHASTSGWAGMESATFRFRDPASDQRRFIPLRLDDTDIKEALARFAYVDWRERTEEQFKRLLAGCRPPVSSAEAATAFGVRGRIGTTLSGHSQTCFCVATSQAGAKILSGSGDGTIRVWDPTTRTNIATLQDTGGQVWGVAATENGQRVVSGSTDGAVRVWDLPTGRLRSTLRTHARSVQGVAVSANGRRAVSGGNDCTVVLWDLEVGRMIATLPGHRNAVYGVAISADGRRAVSASGDSTVRLWDLDACVCTAEFTDHSGGVRAVAMTPDGRRAVSGSYDRTVRVWDLEGKKLIATLEGHTDAVWGVAISADGRRTVSGGADRTLLVWDWGTGKLVSVLKGHTGYIYGVAVASTGRKAFSASDDKTLRVWDLPPLAPTAGESTQAVRYTNAKVLLVGESGVGKTGLAYRLTQNHFKESISTDGAWATQLKLPHKSEREEIDREIWLWDFAGQADYRLIHQLYMDETAVAVLVFNPQSEDPFEGLGQWDRDLQRAAWRPFKKLLVAGRCDRGGLMISRASVDRFREDRHFVEFIETSALLGTGCDNLREAIIRHIPWGDIPWTASPRIFRLLKDEIVALKDEGHVLFRMSELKQQLEVRLPEEVFSLAHLRAVVGLLAGPGVVWQLEFGDFVLLQPERINSYAAAVIRSVRANTDEIGCISEENVLAGKLDYQDMKRLPHIEEQIVLRAMHQIFVDHGLCLREHTDQGTQLILPSYFKRERPDLDLPQA